MGDSLTCVSFTSDVGLFQRNAVLTDACEEWTVPHTVPLRGGAIQRDSCAVCF